MPNAGGIESGKLRSFIERIERLDSDRQQLSDDIKEVYSEAKGAGFDVKIMRQIVKERRLDKDDVDEHEHILNLYRAALAGWDSTPLGTYSEAAE
jgi:uncharacterized protein (UPF0335 family)